MFNQNQSRNRERKRKDLKAICQREERQIAAHRS